jgi:hypothetical protein
MPRVTMWPASAMLAASASVSLKPATFATWWSEGSTTMMPFGSRAATCTAARAMAGAVLRATGSTRMLALGRPFTSFAAFLACTGPQTMKVFFTVASPLRREAVSVMSGCLEASGRNCLGRA